MASSQHARPRFIEKIASLGLRVPLNVLKHFRGSAGDDDDGFPLHNIGRAVERYACDIVTPFGQIVQSMPVQLADKSMYDCPILHPLALLWFLCSVSAQFASLIADHCVDGVFDIVLWADDAVSGNSLRPDASRKFMSVYWSVLQLPEYARSADWGWLPFTIVSANCLKTVQAELSGLLRRTLHVFFLKAHRTLLLDSISSLARVARGFGANRIICYPLWVCTRTPRYNRQSNDSLSTLGSVYICFIALAD